MVHIQRKLVALLAGLALITVAQAAVVQPSAVVREMTVINDADGNATAEFVLTKRGPVVNPPAAIVNLGSSVRAEDVLPTVHVRPIDRQVAAAQTPPNGVAAEQRLGFRVEPARLKDNEFSERLARLVGQTITVNFAGDTKFEDKTGKLTAYDDADITLAGVKIARNRIFSVTLPSAATGHALEVIMTANDIELHYRRPVKPWLMTYRLEVSTNPATSRLLATAVINNPTPHELTNATVILRQSEFDYKFKDVDLGPNRTGAFVYQHKGKYQVPIGATRQPTPVFDASAETKGSPHIVVEIRNQAPDGINLVGGPWAVFVDGALRREIELGDLFHASRFPQHPIPAFGTSLHLHPSQRFVDIKEVSTLSVTVKGTGSFYQPRSLLHSNLTFNEAYTLTNSARAPASVLLILASKRRSNLSPVLSVGAPAAKQSSSTTEFDSGLKVDEKDVRLLSESELQALSGRPGISRSLKDALQQLADFRKNLDKNQAEQEQLRINLQQATLRVDALAAVNDGSLAALSRLGNAQPQLSRTQRDLQESIRRGELISSGQAQFLANAKAP